MGTPNVVQLKLPPLPHVPLYTTQDFDSASQLSFSWCIRVNWVYDVHPSVQPLECSFSGNGMRPRQLDVLALVGLMPQGTWQPPGTSGHQEVEVQQPVLPLLSPCVSSSESRCRAVVKSHNGLNVSEIQGVSRNGILWSISSETGLNVALRNQSSPTLWSQEEAWCEGALVLAQGLGMQLWQDPLGGELQITWHTLVATGAVKETVFWMDYSFVLCKHTTK